MTRLFDTLPPRPAAFALLAVVLAFAPREASAQTVNGRGSIGTPAEVDLSLIGELATSITLTISGSIDLTSSQPTVVTGAGTSGLVNFGTYNIALPLLTGEKHRVNTGPPANRGTYLVATLTASVLMGGGLTNATIDIQRTNPIGGALDVPNGRLLFARPAGGTKNAQLAWPKWTAFPDPRFGSSVFTVPLSTHVPGGGNLDATMTSADALDHQVAVWIPDSTPPSAFSTLVTYTGTAP